MKYVICSIIFCLIITSCSMNKKRNNFNQKTFEELFNKITKGMKKEPTLRLTGKPYKKLTGVKDQGRLIDIYDFELNKTYFRIIFYKNKVTKVIRYSGVVTMNGSLDTSESAKALYDSLGTSESAKALYDSLDTSESAKALYDYLSR
ncbi:MAG: hypothetical protein COA79_26115 [Planctomycetota bacterium]|nr:MAG: hypothetical protein COA79_26115 [Planctomycetota bacterium]